MINLLQRLKASEFHKTVFFVVFKLEYGDIFKVRGTRVKWKQPNIRTVTMKESKNKQKRNKDEITIFQMDYLKRQFKPDSV